jgi:prevent-host-death family protein
VSATLSPSLPADAGPEAFAEAVGRAERDKERVVLTRDGRPVAALVPIEDIEALEAFEDEVDSRLAEEALARWEAEGRPPGKTLEELAAKWGIALGDNAE